MTLSARERGWWPRVLVTDHVDGRSRSAVAAVRALAASGFRPVVTVSEQGSAAAARSRHCAGTVVVPRGDAVGYRAAVERELAARRYAGILAASDVALVALGLPGASLVDKAVLPALAAAAGLRMPETLHFAGPESLLAAAADLPYPVVVKPTVKSDLPIPCARIDGPRAVAAVAARLSGSVVVQPFGAGRMRAVCGVVRDGEVRAVVHQSYLRIYPVDVGVASAAVTVEPDLDMESRLPALLAGHDGVFQLQFVGDLLIDVNPRVYGSLPLAVAAGANLPAIAVGPGPGGLVRGRVGVRYRWMEGDLRRVVADVRGGRFSTLRALRPRRGTAHSMVSLRDPAPLLSRLSEAAVSVARREPRP